MCAQHPQTCLLDSDMPRTQPASGRREPCVRLLCNHPMESIRPVPQRGWGTPQEGGKQKGSPPSAAAAEKDVQAAGPTRPPFRRCGAHEGGLCASLCLPIWAATIHGLPSLHHSTVKNARRSPPNAKPQAVEAAFQIPLAMKATTAHHHNSCCERRSQCVTTQTSRQQRPTCPRSLAHSIAAAMDATNSTRRHRRCKFNCKTFSAFSVCRVCRRRKSPMATSRQQLNGPKEHRGPKHLKSHMTASPSCWSVGPMTGGATKLGTRKV